MLADPTDILLSVLVQPLMPKHILDFLNEKKNENKKEKSKDKIQRQQDKEEEVAREISKQADNKKLWCDKFLETPLEQDIVDESDVAQNALL